MDEYNKAMALQKQMEREERERNDAMNLSNEISSSGPLTIKIIDLYRVRNRSSTKMRELSLSLAISKD